MRLITLMMFNAIKFGATHLISVSASYKGWFFFLSFVLSLSLYYYYFFLCPCSLTLGAGSIA
jgi:hypothetical protein